MAGANPDKGEVELGGLMLRMSFGSWRAFEQSSKRKLPDLMLDLAAGLSVDEYLKWIIAFAAEPTDETAALAAMDRAGFTGVVAAFRDLNRAFFGEAMEGEGNPPQA